MKKVGFIQFIFALCVFSISVSSLECETGLSPLPFNDDPSKEICVFDSVIENVCQSCDVSISRCEGKSNDDAICACIYGGESPNCNPGVECVSAFCQGTEQCLRVYGSDERTCVNADYNCAVCTVNEECTFDTFSSAIVCDCLISGDPGSCNGPQCAETTCQSNELCLNDDKGSKLCVDSVYCDGCTAGSKCSAVPGDPVTGRCECINGSPFPECGEICGETYCTSSQDCFTSSNGKFCFETEYVNQICSACTSNEVCDTLANDPTILVCACKYGGEKGNCQGPTCQGSICQGNETCLPTKEGEQVCVSLAIAEQVCDVTCEKGICYGVHNPSGPNNAVCECNDPFAISPITKVCEEAPLFGGCQCDNPTIGGCGCGESQICQIQDDTMQGFCVCASGFVFNAEQNRCVPDQVINSIPTVDCVAWGDVHYRPFNGQNYDFHGRCSYILLRNGEVEIQVQNGECTYHAFPYPISCTLSIGFTEGANQVEMTLEGEVFVNGAQINSFPANVSGAVIETSRLAKLSSGIIIEISQPLYWYTLKVPRMIAEKSVGLCGNLYAIPPRFPVSPLTIHDRSESWIVNGTTGDSVIFPQENSECAITGEIPNPFEFCVNDPTLREQLLALCKIPESLEKCRAFFDLSTIQAACFFDLCNNVTMTDNYYAEWDNLCSNTLTALNTCDNCGQFEECVASDNVPPQYSCQCIYGGKIGACLGPVCGGVNCDGVCGQTIDGAEICIPNDIFTEVCGKCKGNFSTCYGVAGEIQNSAECVCAEGYTLSPITRNCEIRPLFGDCVPCTDNQNEGCGCGENQICEVQAPNQNFGQCVCANGFISNSDNGECVPITPPQTPVVSCRSFGDPHYRTFSQSFFDFHGKCDYVLVRTASLEVHTRNGLCTNFPPHVSCTLGLAFSYAGDIVEYTNNKVFVNGTEIVSFPHSLPSGVFFQSLVVSVLPDGSRIAANQAGLPFFEVFIPRALAFTSEGLCGNLVELAARLDAPWNTVIERSVSWAVDAAFGDPILFSQPNSAEECRSVDVNVTNPFDCSDPITRIKIEELCEIPEELFACRNQIDLLRLQAACIFDLCAAFPERVVFDWSSWIELCNGEVNMNDVCGNCSANEQCETPDGNPLNAVCSCVFGGNPGNCLGPLCGDSNRCTLDQTCIATINGNQICVDQTVVENVCNCGPNARCYGVEADPSNTAACVCDENYSLSAASGQCETDPVFGDCVPGTTTSCGENQICVQQVQNAPTGVCVCAPGFVTVNGQCVSANPNPSPVVSCVVWGDPHYRPFNGQNYDFHGWCSYVLLRNDDLEIHVQNGDCIFHNIPYPISCTLSLAFLSGAQRIEMEVATSSIFVDGVKITSFPHNLASGGVITSAGQVNLPNQVTISAVYSNYRFTVSVPREIAQTSVGLCGNLQSIPPRFPVPNTIYDRSYSWEVNNTDPAIFTNATECKPITGDIPDPYDFCENDPERRRQVEQLCAIPEALEKCKLLFDLEAIRAACFVDLCLDLNFTHPYEQWIELCESTVDDVDICDRCSVNEVCAISDSIPPQVFCECIFGGNTGNCTGPQCGTVSCPDNELCRATVNGQPLCVPVDVWNGVCQRCTGEYSDCFAIQGDAQNSAQCVCTDPLTTYSPITGKCEKDSIFGVCVPCNGQNENCGCGENQVCQLQTPTATTGNCVCAPGFFTDPNGEECIPTSGNGNSVLTCSAYGDPHFTSFSRSYYDFHGRCDYVFYKNDEVEIHIRSQECPTFPHPVVSCTTGMAIFYGDNTIEMFGGNSLFVDGVAVTSFPQALTSGVIIPSKNLVRLPNGISLQITSFYNYILSVPAPLTTSSVGLCGNTSVIPNRSGAVISDVLTRSTSWTVSADDRTLFSTAIECSGNTGGNAPNPVNFCDENPEIKLRIEALCQVPAELYRCKALIDLGMIRAACMFDLCVNPDAIFDWSQWIKLCDNEVSMDEICKNCSVNQVCVSPDGNPVNSVCTCVNAGENGQCEGPLCGENRCNQDQVCMTTQAGAPVCVLETVQQTVCKECKGDAKCYGVSSDSAECLCTNTGVDPPKCTVSTCGESVCNIEQVCLPFGDEKKPVCVAISDTNCLECPNNATGHGCVAFSANDQSDDIKGECRCLKPDQDGNCIPLFCDGMWCDKPNQRCVTDSVTKETKCVCRNSLVMNTVSGTCEEEPVFSGCSPCTFPGERNCGCAPGQVCQLTKPLPASGTCVCAPGFIPSASGDCLPGPTSTPPVVSCSSWGDPHYISFSNERYDWHGRCDYILVRTNGTEIHSRNGNCPGSIPATISCTIGIAFFDGKHKVEMMEGANVFVDGSLLNMFPTTLSTGTIISSKNLVLLPNGIRIEVNYNSYWYTVFVPSSLAIDSDGLCGSLQSVTPRFAVSSNDIPTRSNTWVVTPEDTTIFSTANPTETCEIIDGPNPYNFCTQDPDLREKVNKLCAIPAELERCAKLIDLSAIQSGCVFDLCHNDQFSDNYYAPWIKFCQQQINLNTGCNPKCPDDQLCAFNALSLSFKCEPRTVCDLKCPTGQTCDIVSFNDRKFPRCVCSPGYVPDPRNRKNCIKEGSCGEIECNKENEVCSLVQQSDGLKFLCECMNGTTRNIRTGTCEPKADPTVFGRCLVCPENADADFACGCKDPNQVCQQSTRGAKYGKCVCRDKFVLNDKTGECDPIFPLPANADLTCSVYGDPHFTQFDDQYFTDMGKCDVILAESPNGLKIHGRQTECFTGVKIPGVSCLTGVAISHPFVPKKIQLTDLVTSRGKGNFEVYYGDEKLAVGNYNFPNCSIIILDGGSLVKVVDGTQINYNSPFGLSITLPASYTGKVDGLCGTTDHFKTDEWVLTASESLFSTPNPDCVQIEKKQDTQTIYPNSDPNCELLAREPCLNLFVNATGSNCSEIIDSATFYSACVLDFCSSGEYADVFVSTSLSALVDRCSSKVASYNKAITPVPTTPTSTPTSSDELSFASSSFVVSFGMLFAMTLVAIIV